MRGVTEEMILAGKNKEIETMLTSFNHGTPVAKPVRARDVVACAVVLSSRWELKGKTENEQLCCRARFVAATTSVSTSRIIDFKAIRNHYKVWTLDVSNAFFHVPEDELCYVRPPVEWLARQQHDDWMWLLLRLLNGRRKGPQKWVQ